MLRGRRDIVVVAVIVAVIAALTLLWGRSAPSLPVAAHPPTPRAPPPAATAPREAPVPTERPAPPRAPAASPSSEQRTDALARAKPRPEAWQDDEVYLHDLLEIAVRAIDPEAAPDELDLFCTPDYSRCRVRAPLLDDAIDEDALWSLARAAVAEAAAGDAALTRVRALDPEGEASLIELEITLVVD